MSQARCPMTVLGPLALSALFLITAQPLGAQLISIKTLPVAQGDQFDVFPSLNQGMGGVSIALPDTLLDPFRNPAKGGRLSTPRFLGSPIVYGVSNNAGGGRTLPVAVIAPLGSWFGALSIAVQEVDPSTPPGSVLMGPPPPGVVVQGPLPIVVTPPAPESHGNAYVFALIGKTLPQDVSYLDLFWDPGTQSVQQRPRVDHELDRTDTWGLALQYARPLTASGWRIGWLATGNLMSHPKIPNYALMNIPRDPGHSHAYQVGVGVARVSGPATFGLDAVYEPIWSDTWAAAAAPTATSAGDTIPVGGRTIENRFHFSNFQFRMGIGRDIVLSGRPRGATWQ